MNKVILTGRIVRDIELQKTQAGDAYARFSLAVRRNTKAKNGEYPTEFINLVAFKNTAEFLVKHCGKGDKILVEGEIKTVTYKDKEGKNKYLHNILVNSTEFLERKKYIESEQSNANIEDFDVEGIIANDGDV